MNLIILIEIISFIFTSYQKWKNKKKSVYYHKKCVRIVICVHETVWQIGKGWFRNLTAPCKMKRIVLSIVFGKYKRRAKFPLYHTHTRAPIYLSTLTHSTKYKEENKTKRIAQNPFPQLSIEKKRNKTKKRKNGSVFRRFHHHFPFPGNGVVVPPALLLWEARPVFPRSFANRPYSHLGHCLP